MRALSTRFLILLLLGSLGLPACSDPPDDSTPSATEATPTPTSEATATATVTAAPTATATPEATPTAALTPTAELTPTASPELSPTADPTPTAAPTPTAIPTPTATAAPTPTATAAPTPTATVTPTPTATVTPTVTPTPTLTPTPTAPTDEDGDGHPLSEDCDDGDPAIHPGAAEICNGEDDDCDGAVDLDDDDLSDAQTYYADEDGDGFGDPGTGALLCAPAGVTNDEDCNDADPSVSPSGEEACSADPADEDCDGEVDEGPPGGASTYYADLDGDGFIKEGSELLSCLPPEGYIPDPGLAFDCNDADPEITPETACDFEVTFVNPGPGLLYLASEEANAVDLFQSGALAATHGLGAGEAVATGALAGGTYTLRAPSPFVAHVVTSAGGGDQTAVLRSLDGGYLGRTLVGWAGNWLSLANPGSADVNARIDTLGEGWEAGATILVPAGETASVALSAGYGYHRVVADGALSGYGLYLQNIENHYEYMVGIGGTRVDTRFLYELPALIGKPGLVGQCVDPTGCGVNLSADGEPAESWTLGEGETFAHVVGAAIFYEVVSDGRMILKAEATPYGFDAADGTTLDADTVPGLNTGGANDTDFILATCMGIASGLGDRRSDVHVIAYTEDTAVSVERLDAEDGWTPMTSETLGAGEVFTVGTNLDPRQALRITTSQPVSVQLNHDSFEFAFSLFSDHQDR